jgi:PPOX class probable FMN-dependent enzyme
MKPEAFSTNSFTTIVTSEEELRALVGEPSELSLRKQQAELDAHCRAFIVLSPFLAIGTIDANGRCDVSPRGDAPGFVQVLDNKTLIIPERSGNRRVDTLRNILQTGTVGLLFMVPGVEETLRINGHAWLVRDEDLMERMAFQGKRPLLAIGITVEECFLQCAKALKRSHLWNAEHWPERSALPSLAEMLLDQTKLPNTTLADLEALFVESYTKRLY